MRRLFALISVMLLVSMGGCIGVETFEADPITVSDDTLDETEYKLADNRTFRINESREILGSDRGAEIISYMNLYQKNLSDMHINFTESQLEDMEVQEMINSSDIDPVEVIGEDEMIQRIADSSDQYTVSDIEFVLDQTGKSLEEFMDSNDINPTEYVSEEEIVESLSADQVNTLLNNNSDKLNQEGSVVFAVSTPSAGLFGTEINPLIIGSSEDLINIIESEGGQNIEVGEQENLVQLEHKSGSMIPVEKYPATVKTGEGQEIDSELLIAKNEGISDNLLVTIAIYPEFTDGEEDSHKMIKSISVSD